MWLISTANPRGTVLVFPLLLCVSFPVWACVHTRAYRFHSETSVTPPEPTEAGILKAAIAWGQGLWELGETLSLDFRTLTSHMTSYETGLFLALNTILKQLPRKSVCSEEQQPRTLRDMGRRCFIILTKMVPLRCWLCSSFRIWRLADVQTPGAWGGLYPRRLMGVCHFETCVSRGPRRWVVSAEWQ